jgi:hypothetical protein
MAPPQRELVALDHHKLAMHPIDHIKPAVYQDHALRSAQMARGGGPEPGRGYATSAAAKEPGDNYGQESPPPICRRVRVVSASIRWLPSDLRVVCDRAQH